MKGKAFVVLQGLFIPNKAAKMQTLNKNLKFLRKSAGLTQEQVASAIGEKMRTYASWENLDVEPPLHKLSILARMYNLTIDELITNPTKNKIDLLSLKFAAAPTHIRKAILTLLEINS